MTNYINTIRSSIGGRKEQQDFSGSSNTKFGLLVIVCDGMGGAKGGATASRMAVEIVISEFNTTTQNSVASVLAGAIQKANTEIYHRSRNDENCRGMGSTITAIVLQEEKATIAHVGDSRIYQLRRTQILSRKPEIVYRTSDHSKVFELVRRGIMSEEQARVSDESNVILRALGIKPNVDIELKDDLPYLKRDWFMLCTDGICGAVSESTLLNMLSLKGDVQTVLNSLINKIDRIGKKNGGEHDNLTAAIVECPQNSMLKNPINMQSKIIIVTLAVLLLLSLGYGGLSTYRAINTRETARANSVKFREKLDSVQKINSQLRDLLKKKKDEKDLKKPLDSALKDIAKQLQPHDNKHETPHGKKDNQIKDNYNEGLDPKRTKTKPGEKSKDLQEKNDNKEE